MIRTVTKSLDPASAGQTLTLLGAHELVVTSADSNAATWCAHAQPGKQAEEVRLENLAAVRAAPHAFLWNVMLPSADDILHELLEAREQVSSSLGGSTTAVVLHAPGATPQDLTPLRRLAERVEPGVVVVTGALPTLFLTEIEGEQAANVVKAARVLVHQLRFGLPLIASKPRGVSTPEEPEEEPAAAAGHDQAQRVGAGFIGLLELHGGAFDAANVYHVEAAAKASLETGAPIFLALHDGLTEFFPDAWRIDLALTLLAVHGAPAASIVLCRLPGALRLEELYVKWLRNGFNLSFSFHGSVFYNNIVEDKGQQTFQDWPGDAEAAALVASLCQQGFASQLLCSPSVACRIQLRRYGGHGYGHVRHNVIPQLLRRGVSPEDVEKMERANIVRLLAWWTPPPPVERPVETGRCDWCGKVFEIRGNEHFSKFAWTYCRGKCLSAHGNTGWRPLEPR